MAEVAEEGGIDLFPLIAPSRGKSQLPSPASGPMPGANDDWSVQVKLKAPSWLLPSTSTLKKASQGTTAAIGSGNEGAGVGVRECATFGEKGEWAFTLARVGGEAADVLEPAHLDGVA